LPHRSKLTEAGFEEAAGPSGWNGQQGFYVYREDRLITAGDWLSLGFPRGDLHNLARISIDVPIELDFAWSLDVSKASVRPPNALRDELRRIARETRRRAERVVRHRGAPVGKPSRKTVVPVWEQLRRHGELVLRVNRHHPLIEELLERLREHRRALGDVLSIIEETIPVPLLPAAPRDGARKPLEDLAPDEVVHLAERLYESLLRRGLSRDDAIRRLMDCEPFYEYPDLPQMIQGDR
jgi:hypothetical protein